jgi:hypothetical protein
VHQSGKIGREQNCRTRRLNRLMIQLGLTYVGRMNRLPPVTGLPFVFEVFGPEWQRATFKQSPRPRSRNYDRGATPGIARRGLSRLEVAALTGLSPTGFDKARREGKYPGPTLPGGRYDRSLLEKTMDRMSGLHHEASPKEIDDTWSDFDEQINEKR